MKVSSDPTQVSVTLNPGQKACTGDQNEKSILHPSSYAPAWTVKSKKNQKNSKKFQIFLRETLTKVLSACKNSSWNHIPRRRGKKNKKSTLKKLLSNAFWSTEFVFFLPCLTGMWFHDEILQALRIFVNVSHKNN